MATTVESGAADYQQRQAMRPRSKSAFSVTSDKSHSSRRSADKERFRESHDEKRKLAFSNTTKANPNAAMNELQPSELRRRADVLGCQGANCCCYSCPAA
jgi:hypothetical protein